MNAVLRYLVDHGISPSVQRLAAVHYLLEDAVHLTTDEIYTEPLSQIPAFSKAEVYNTLKLFMRKKIAVSAEYVRFNGNIDPYVHFRRRK